MAPHTLVDPFVASLVVPGDPERKQSLNLSAIDVLAAASIAVCYVALMALGEVMTRINPDIVPRRLSI